MSVDYKKISHNLSPGDRVRAKGFRSVAVVVEIAPLQHWENRVTLDKPLNSYIHWDAHELEKVDGVSERR